MATVWSEGKYLDLRNMSSKSPIKKTRREKILPKYRSKITIVNADGTKEVVSYKEWKKRRVDLNW